ncbi:SDR family NAD(P)-dependent oxidoreductase [Lutibaculum baratangense]|uniref:Oxidoreductase, short-chain dehydrogenase/reductase family n=1 Tax=Lutibaculum baratangense AMV1 TaxID=631454 RepID=V4RE00_9HYPH|nr:SDR family NAD(P)-dependent oxidoreductase [Lutibaculum baratangense]ESR23614.1 Oxidoreductase, short-chain dehydrogenase/reductase family [Lutibaculum baratangense AMV1]
MTLDLKNRVAVLTGASRGIGYAVAKELAKTGIHQVLVARTVGGLEELDDEVRALGGSATLVPLDITDMQALDRLGASIHERWGRLDALIANAGVLGVLAPLSQVKAKDWEQTMTVNLTANWRLLRSLDPLLRKSDAGRAVFMTSGAARRAKAYWGPYSVSKAALEMMVRIYSQEVAMTPLRANLFNPGPVRTAMRAKAMPGEDPQSLPHPSELAPAIVDMLSPELDRNGEVYDWPSRSWMSPGPAA